MNAYRDKQWLIEQYRATGSIYRIAELAGCHPRTIHSWMTKHNIPMTGMEGRKHSKEAKQKISMTVKSRPGGMTGKRHSCETKKAMSISREGEKNANWKGGKTSEIRRFRRSKEYITWRSSVLERAGNKCEECGATENIEAHHKISLHKDISKGLDIDNGQALCHKCHKKKEKNK